MIQTTGVGSVPFDDASEAVRHVFAAYDVPFFPQVTRRLGDLPGVAPMLREILTPAMAACLMDGAGIERALAAADDEAAAAVLRQQPAFTAFTAALTAWTGGTIVKTQMAGPHTVAALTQASLAAAWSWCERLTHAWVRVLRPYTTQPLLIIWDDSLLPARGGADDLARFAALRQALVPLGAELGIHTCAPADLAQLARALPGAALSIDASVTDCVSPAAQKTLRHHAQSGARILIGLFDTRHPALDVEAGLALARNFTALQIPLWFTGGCGTALHAPEYERLLAQQLRAAARPPQG